VRLDSDDQEVYTQYFTYDASGNRTKLEPSGTLGTEHVTYQYNDADELTCHYTETSATYYTYDGSGNTIEKDDGGAVTYYSYDPENRFTAYEKGGDVVYYIYDADGRRIRREHGSGGSKSSTGFGSFDIGSRATLTCPSGVMKTGALKAR
jgi:YD repeat-containing protein